MEPDERLLPVIYELEPIGVDGALEAVTVHWYCSEACRDKHNDFYEGPIAKGLNSDTIEGTVCEYCLVELRKAT